MVSQVNVQFVKYGSIEEVSRCDELKNMQGNGVMAFEKIDGGLCQVRNIDRKLFPGSKANFLTGSAAKKTEWFHNFIAWAYSNPALYRLPEEVVLFGEWSGNHTIDYGANNDRFFVIDLLNLATNRFFRYDKAKCFLDWKGIEEIKFLPILAFGGIEKKTLDSILEQPSYYYPGPKEGIVIKDYAGEEQTFVKMLNPGFAEKRARLFGRTDPFTEARVRKNLMSGIEQYSREDLTFDTLYNLISVDIKKETGRTYNPDYVKKRVDSLLKVICKRQGVKFVPSKY